MKQSREIVGIGPAPDGVAGALRLSVAAAAGIPPSFAHARRLLDRFGMVQFARGATPDLDFGYCLDDNARALLTAMLALHLDPQLEDAQTVGEAALRFMEQCRRPDGRFHNFMAADGSFTDEVGSQESLGRALWACGVAVRCSPLAAWRHRAQPLLESALSHVEDLVDLRPKAYAILALAAMIAPEQASLIPSRAPLTEALSETGSRVLKQLCASLAEEFERRADSQWQWFEPILTWGNARLPEAVLRGGVALRDSELQAVGLRALKFLVSVTHERDMFVPIGNRGWYKRGSSRAIYDQQPIEACCMVDMWLAAAKTAGRLEYRSKALEALCWFSGLNTERLAVVDARSGGCRDGLGRGELNMNMGAESTLSYLHAHAALAAALRENSSGATDL